ncbi:RING/U-box superfamily protein [Rhynchospora pubera]|uniref:RING/U-box superfamily protein n=1 Tax=Rhynchospora pubera TaxID=906938 RepID=A0AAV8FLW1_9POAL|nr:RING/U-box superfamily protein [Rhynchospora pubera]
MGATCCKAATDKQPLITPFTRLRSPVPCSTWNTIRHSPSWSFRWDHRTHIEDDIIIGTGSARYSHDNDNRNGSETISSQNGSPCITAREVRPENLNLRKNEKARAGPQNDKSMVSGSSSLEIKVFGNASTSAQKVGPTPSDPEPSKRTRHSPGYTLYRQVSDSHIPSLKSSFNSLSNISHSLDPLYSLSNNSSEGWSMRTFSQLVGSTSQRDMGSSFNSSTEITTTPSPDLQSCKICSRILKERSPFSTQKIVSTRECPVIAVLPCSHVFHADCLDNITIEVDQYDPNCPICNCGDKFGAKFGGKIKVSRNAVVDMDVAAGSYGEPGTRRGISSSKRKGPKRSFSQPFLKKHFSVGSARPETERKKWFWDRYRKD